jgi:hypothetical protein
MINQRIGITDATRAFIADAVAHGYNADWLSLNIVQLSLCDVENKSLHQASIRFEDDKFKNVLERLEGGGSDAVAGLGIKSFRIAGQNRSRKSSRRLISPILHQSNAGPESDSKSNSPPLPVNRLMPLPHCTGIKLEYQNVGGEQVAVSDEVLRLLWAAMD